MNKFALVAALVAGTLAGGAAVAGDRPSPIDNDPNRINISCYRGALPTVAWDRANAVFIQDLMQVGYSYEKATVIAEHICRDEFGVRNAEHQVMRLKEVLRADPPR